MRVNHKPLKNQVMTLMDAHHRERVDGCKAAVGAVQRREPTAAARVGRTLVGKQKRPCTRPSIAVPIAGRSSVEGPSSSPTSGSTPVKSPSPATSAGRVSESDQLSTGINGSIRARNPISARIAGSVSVSPPPSAPIGRSTSGTNPTSASFAGRLFG